MQSPSFVAKSGAIKFLLCPGRAGIASKFLAISGTAWKVLSPTPPKSDKVELRRDEEKNGALAVIDPRTATLVKMLNVDNCNPAGIAFGPNDNFVLSCTADGNRMPAIITIMNTKTGEAVANFPDIGGADIERGCGCTQRIVLWG